MNDIMFLVLKDSNSAQNKYLNSSFKSLKNEYISHDFIQEIYADTTEYEQQRFTITRNADLFIVELIKIPIEYNLCDIKCLIMEVSGSNVYNIPFNLIMLMSNITQTTKYNIIKLPQELFFVNNPIRIPLALRFHEVKIIIQSNNVFSCLIYGRYTFLSNDYRRHIAQIHHKINIKSYYHKHNLDNKITYNAGDRLFGLFIKYCVAIDDDLNVQLVNNKNPNNIIVLHGEKIQSSWIIFDNKQHNNNLFKPIKNTTTNHNNFKEQIDNIYWYPREPNKKWYEQTNIDLINDNIEYNIVFSKPLCCTLYLVKNNALLLMFGMSAIAYHYDCLKN